MKLVKGLVLALIVTSVLSVTGISATTSGYTFFTGWQIPAWQGTITSDQKEKNDYGGEVIHTIGTYFNRNVQYKINDHDGHGSTNWRTISVVDNQVVTRINDETTANIPVIFAGTKSLSMKTSVNWLTSKTSYSGSWWLSESDYDKYY